MLPLVASDPKKLESAQSALLVAVIKATPNEVILSVARDYFCTAFKDFVTTTTSYIPSYGSPLSYLPSLPSLSYQPLKGITDHAGHGIDTGSKSNDDGIRMKSCDIQLKDKDKEVHAFVGKRESIKFKSSRIYQQQKYQKLGDDGQTNKKYELILAFIKLIVKLLLNFILEIVSFTLRFV